jgi:hypothetical protein
MPPAAAWPSEHLHHDIRRNQRSTREGASIYPPAALDEATNRLLPALDALEASLLLETSHGNEAHILQDNWRLTQENQQRRALIDELTQSSKPGSS